MQPDDLQDLRALSLFGAMEQTQFDLLLRNGDIRTYPAMTDVLHEGDPAMHLHIVLSGGIELYSRWNGRESSMDRLRPGAPFIIAAAIKDGPYLLSARSIEPARVALIPSDDVRAVLASDNRFARAILTELAQSYRSAIKTGKNIKLRDSVERLANHLLHQHRETNLTEFELTMEKRQLASLLGMTPENMSRAIRALRAHGVRFHGGRVQITDADALLAFARPNPLIDDQTT